MKLPKLKISARTSRRWDEFIVGCVLRIERISILHEEDDRVTTGVISGTLLAGWVSLTVGIYI